MRPTQFLLRVVTTVMVVLCVHPTEARASAAVVGISNVSDLSLPTWSIGDPTVTGHMDICIYGINLTGTTYAITVSSPSGFNLSSGTNQIPFSLYWDDGGAGALGSNSGTQLSNNVKLTSQANANILSPLCSLGLSGPNARFDISIAQADMTTALAGTYSGTISILLSAN